MKNKIRVAIVGVGNCASSLIQGIEYYKDNSDIIGLMNYDIEIQAKEIKSNLAHPEPNLTSNILEYPDAQIAIDYIPNHFTKVL